MTIKSIGEKIDTLCNISSSTGTNKLDKIIKGMCKIYTETIIANDTPPYTRVKKHQFYTLDQADPTTSYIYYTVLKEDIPRFHRALGLDALGGSVRLDNGISSPSQQETFSWLKCLDEIIDLLVEYSIG